jgi:hypothetical protein
MMNSGPPVPNVCFNARYPARTEINKILPELRAERDQLTEAILIFERLERIYHVFEIDLMTRLTLIFETVKAKRLAHGSVRLKRTIMATCYRCGAPTETHYFRASDMPRVLRRVGCETPPVV